MTGSDDCGGTMSDALSPELALVSPELAEAARLQLPERPWDLVPRAAVAPRQPMRLQPQETERIRQLAATALTLSEHDDLARRHRVRRVLTLAVALVSAMSVLVVGGVRPPGRDREAVLTRPPVVDAATPPLTRRAWLLPRAGYVVSPAGSLLTDHSGQTIQFFTLPLRCPSQKPVIRNIPVRGRSFRFVGTTVGTRVGVRVRGRVIDRRHIRGVVTTDHATCQTHRVAFTARLS